MFPKTKQKHPSAILLSRVTDATNEVSGAQECSSLRPFANLLAAIASAALLINSPTPAQAQFPWSRSDPKRSDQPKGKGQAPTPEVAAAPQTPRASEQPPVVKPP